ncbi:sodium-dependent transporter [Halobacteriaceae archaeon GCM10025711]
MTRESWATRVGFILAAVGSAVGLGNIWRFPWMTAEQGGSAFLLLYLLIVVGVGVPGLLGEFVIGRRAKRNPVGALESLSGSKTWGRVGLITVVTAIFLLSFYSVVGGWIVRYFLGSVTGAYFAQPGAYFDSISFGWQAAGFHVVFLLVTALIVLAGVRRGIEVATKVMMPAIVVLLVGLAAWAVTRPGAGAGLEFYLAFDAAYLRANFFDVLIAAAGQALFTLSVGAGTMITYASYLGEDRSLPVDGVTIGFLNTFVGVLAGFVVFPLLFAQGIEPGAGGPGALFVSIAGAFSTLPAGRLIAAVFFGVVTLAALSSSISMLEIPVSYLVDEFGVSRRRAVAGLSVLFLVTGGVNALNPGVFDFVASTLVDLLLTGGLLAFLLFVGWVLGRDALDEFTTGAGPLASALGTPWLYAVGVVLPLFLLFTLLTGVFSAFGLSVDVALTVALTAALGLGAFVGLRRPQSVIPARGR